MNYNHNSQGWGAYQNKKKENENLKKNLIVQDINKFGERIVLNDNKEFMNVSSVVNPFRFLISGEKEKTEYDSKTCEINKIDFFNELLNKINLKIEENDEIIKNITLKYEEKLTTLKKEYENKLLEQKNIYNSYVESKKSLIFLQNEIISNKNNKVLTPITMTITEEAPTQNNTKIVEEAPTQKKQTKTNKKRPTKLNECFKTDTIFHHCKCGNDEYAKYIVKQDCIYRYNINEDATNHDEIFYSLNDFTVSNYSKKNKINKTNRTTANNAYLECKYKDNKTGEWVSCNNIQIGSILNDK
jgi:hypothetical protein